MADEYVKRKDLANEMCKSICGEERGLCVSLPENCNQRMMKPVFAVPAADVAPVRRGRWIYGNGYRSCPICHDGRRTIVMDNYCPNCGAKMDGGTE